MRADQVVPKGLPTDWRTTKLAAVVDSLTSGARPPGGGTADSDGVFSIGGEHITERGTLDVSAEVYVPADFFREIREKAEIRNRDVLINKDGANTGKLAIARVGRFPQPACINEHVFRLRTDVAEIDQTYAFYFLLSELGRKQILPLVQGSAQPGLNQRFTKYVHLWFPNDRDEQVAIAGILDAVDTALEHNRAAIDRARDLERATLEDVFENLHAPIRQLREFTTDVRYGTSRASSERGWGNPVLRIPNVIADRLSLHDLAFVELPPPDVDRLSLQDGDLLLVRTNGNPNYVGRSVVFRHPDRRIWVYASYLIRVRLKSGLLADFVNVYLGLERGRRELLRRVTTSAGNHNINSNSIRLLKLPVPEGQDEQAAVVRLAGVLRKQVDALQAKSEALETLKKALMHDLLTGRVRLRDVAPVAAI